MTIMVKGVITRLRVSQAFLSFKYLLVFFFFCLCPGQNLFHSNFFIAFSSTRFCPISLTCENRKAQVGKAPAERWGSPLGMRLMENGSHVFWENFSKFACIYDEVTVWNLLQCVFRLASLCWEVEKASLYTQCPESSWDTKSLFSFE